MALKDGLSTMINETTVLYAILGFIWIESIWTNYLSYRQERKCKNSKEVPKELSGVLSKETFDKARLYSLDKLHYGFVRDTISLLISTATVYCGLFAKLWNYADSINPWEGEVAVSCIWIFLLTVINNVLDMPLDVYFTFVLEEKYGFNKQTARFYIIDKIKWFIFQQALTLPLSAMTIIIIKYGGPFFFVWLWLVVGVVSLLMLTIYPTYIAPIFDKYTPLPEGELRTEIENLASNLKFPLTQLYVVEGSKRSSHSNAFFYGLFNSKRIVLYDTLLKKPDEGGCSNNEILAVVSHELGHWNYNHIIKNIVIMQTNLLFMFLFFSFMFQFAPLYKALGFPQGVQPVLVGLMIITQYIMGPYNSLLSFVMSCLSRSFEFQADRFAAQLGKAEALGRSLIQINKDNLGFPICDWLFSMWHHSHPPLLERLAALEKMK